MASQDSSDKPEDKLETAELEGAKYDGESKATHNVDADVIVENSVPSSSALKPNVKSNSVNRVMRKDDSGIYVERDDDDTDEPDHLAAKKKKKKHKHGSSNVTNTDDTVKSPPSRADSGHHDSDTSSCIDFKDNSNDESDAVKMHDTTDDASLSHGSPTCSEDEDANEKSVDDKKVERASDDNDDADAAINYLSGVGSAKLKHKWNVTKEVFRRPYGVANRISSDRFKLRCHGSLHVVERLELMYKMASHEGCVNALNFNGSGTRLASGSDDLNITVWDWTIGEPVLVYDSGHRSNVFQAKYMPLCGDCHIVSCARDGQVRIAELSSTGVCKGTKKLAQHRGSAHKLALECDSPHVFLSCGEDAVVFQVDLRDSKPDKLLTCKNEDSKVPLYAIQSNPYNSNQFIVGGRNQWVRVYDKRKLQDESGELKKYCPHHLISNDIRANVTCCVYSHDGREILSSYSDEDIYLFDSTHSDQAEYVRKYQGHRNSKTVKGVNFFGPSSQYVISGSDCGNIYFWDKETCQIVQCMLGDEGGVVNCLEPHPSFPVLATSGLDDDVKIWIPSCEQAPDLSAFKTTIRNNIRQRNADRIEETESVDSRMLWFIVNRLHRSVRRQDRGVRVGEFSSSDDSSNSNSDDDDNDDPPLQCAPS